MESKKKKCSKCGLKKRMREFDKNRHSKTGYNYSCKSCGKEYAIANAAKIAARKKKHRLEHLEEYNDRAIMYSRRNAKKIAKRNKAWRKTHKKQIKEANRRWHYNHPEQSKQLWRNWFENQKTTLWASWAIRNVIKGTRKRKHRRLPVKIREKDLLRLYKKQKGLDAYTGVPMSISPKSNDPMGISVDRIDSKSGYVNGNICLCCAWINKAKGAMTREQFMAVLLQAAKALGGKDQNELHRES